MRCSPVAIERGEPMRQVRSTAPTSMPSSSDAVATTTLSSPALSRCSAWSRRSRDRLPWWAATALLAEPLAQVRVTRSTSRRVLTKTSVDRCSRASSAIAVVDLVPLLVGAHRAELVVRHLDRQVEIAPLADVDDRLAAVAAAPTSNRAADLQRPHRRRQPDALQARARCGLRHQRLEPLERQREVRAALVGGDRVDLVDDHGAHVAQRPPARARR